MAHLHHNLATVVKGSGQELFWRCRGMMFCKMGLSLTNQRRRSFKNRGLVHCCTSSTSTPTPTTNLANDEKPDSIVNEDSKLQLPPTSTDHHVNPAYEKLNSRIIESDKLQLGYLVRDEKWQVRRMLETEEEMRQVAHVQAEAFHEPAFFFDDVFFKFFKVIYFCSFHIFFYRKYYLRMVKIRAASITNHLYASCRPKCWRGCYTD